MSFRMPDPQELDAAFCDICEEVAFVLVDPAPPDAVIGEEGPYLHSEVELEGVVRGTVAIAGTRPGLREMAANLLGERESDSEADQQGVTFLKELVNITAGVFAGLVTEETGTCDFGVPDCKEMPEARWSELCGDDWSRCYSGMEGPLLWRCTLQDVGTGRIFHGTAVQGTAGPGERGLA